ncbi:MAG: glutaminyl-peptide cyclotransferase [Chloroflexota bacterium]
MKRQSRHIARLPLLLLAAVIAVAVAAGIAPGLAAAQSGNPMSQPVQVFVPEVISVRDHDPSAYTQGLLLHEGLFYESTGRRGLSSLRAVDPETGEVERMIEVPGAYFAEGLALVDDRLIQLTWQENVAFVYDLDSFEQTGTFEYEGEGWGLCYDGERLYMTDGTPFIQLRDPDTFELFFSGAVTLQGQPVGNLNELECVGDYLYANVWKTDYIVQIDKSNGVVVGVIDASGLLTEDERAALLQSDSDAVLNGIAYDAENDAFLITGKLWPKVYEVRFVEQEQE